MAAMNQEAQQPWESRVGCRFLLMAGIVAGTVTLALVIIYGKSLLAWDLPPNGALPRPDRDGQPAQRPVLLTRGQHLTVWWDALPETIRSRSKPAGGASNIHPADYTGPAVCGQCHSKNYESWSTHPHRWMNAPASAATVRGDFSGTATMSYRGGKATFERQNDTYHMRLERDSVRRDYRITQTIGSRFFQYYVGRQTGGPEAPAHHFYQKDQVLPFGWWLNQKEWVPVVHIGPERADEDRPDPFVPPESGMYYAEYAVSCNFCHSTFPLADLLGRRPQQMGEHAPLPLHWSVRPYLAKARPRELAQMSHPPRAGETMQNPMADWDAEHYAATFGVSCEACHLGARAHVESKGEVPPSFFPQSPFLVVENDGKQLDIGRSHANVNWACGRCHVGTRPTFAAGMSTWNSVEYTDAMLGSCYSKLRCVDCHNPHRAIGSAWRASPGQDDAICLKCHEQFRTVTQRQAHTHHPEGSDGARCMNCHMPRINEGIEAVVRTHMIYAPNRADMIEANHPNACNLCHTDRPIDWTIGYLKQWYGTTYDDRQIATHYKDRTGAAALGWLKSDNAAVRLVAADALTRAHDARAMPQLLRALDDTHLVNRQFASMGVEKMLGVHLADFGYRFYQNGDERRKSLSKIDLQCTLGH
jgi:predicted CXXCH cytochrome family protein